MITQMRDPIITLRNILLNNVKDAAGNTVDVIASWPIEEIRQPLVTLERGFQGARTDWIGLQGAGYRRRVELVVMAHLFTLEDLDDMYSMSRTLKERITQEATNHRAAPEYIDFMWVEEPMDITRSDVEADITPRLIHWVMRIHLEWFEYV